MLGGHFDLKVDTDSVSLSDAVSSDDSNLTAAFGQLQVKLNQSQSSLLLT